jgi:hypothetical protein
MIFCRRSSASRFAHDVARKHKISYQRDCAELHVFVHFYASGIVRFLRGGSRLDMLSPLLYFDNRQALFN